MKKVVIIGSCCMSHIAAQTISQLNIGVVLVSSNVGFQPESIALENPYTKDYEKVFYEKVPSKFMSKPKNNFKRR